MPRGLQGVSSGSSMEREIDRLNRLLNERLTDLETLLDLIPVGVAIAEDPECMHIRVNRMGAELLKVPVGCNVSRRGNPSAVASYRTLNEERELSVDELPMQRACRRGEVVRDEELRIVRHDGSSVEVLMSASPLHDAEGRVRGAVGAYVDVSRGRRDRQEAERRARQQAAVSKLGLFALKAQDVQSVLDEAVGLVRETLDVALAKVLELAPGGEYLVLRSGAGWDPGLVGKARVPVDRDTHAGYAMLSQEPVVVEDFSTETRFAGTDLLHQHGVKSGVTVVIEGRETPWGIFGVHSREPRSYGASDIDFVQSMANVVTAALERERMESRLRRSEAELTLQAAHERLRRAERLASIGTLAAGIAHEINNPINSIVMTAETDLSIPERLAQPERMREDLEVIVREAERCGEIIQNVMSFARQEDPERELHDVNILVRQAVELVDKYAQQARAQVTLDLAPGLPRLSVNGTEIEQVLVNLIQNAVEASDGDGLTVHLTTHLLDGGDRMQITVEDDGPGIPADLQRHVFDPFFTTRRDRGGTGLGLSVVHTIVTEHGGSIDVDERAGGGSVFRLELPVMGGD